MICFNRLEVLYHRQLKAKQAGIAFPTRITVKKATCIYTIRLNLTWLWSINRYERMKFIFYEDWKCRPYLGKTSKSKRYYEFLSKLRVSKGASQPTPKHDWQMCSIIKKSMKRSNEGFWKNMVSKTYYECLSKGE